MPETWKVGEQQASSLDSVSPASHPSAQERAIKMEQRAQKIELDLRYKEGELMSMTQMYSAKDACCTKTAEALTKVQEELKSEKLAYESLKQIMSEMKKEANVELCGLQNAIDENRISLEEKQAKIVRAEAAAKKSDEVIADLRKKNNELRVVSKELQAKEVKSKEQYDKLIELREKDKVEVEVSHFNNLQKA